MGESRYDVTAADGVELAVWVEGQGPPLVMVHGSLQDHNPNRTLAAELIGDFTVHALDRRGFGASGDSSDWTIEREFADVARVVETVAATSGQAVTLWGHSFGAAVVVLAQLLQLSEAEIDQMRSTPRWTTIVASAHTIPREARAEQRWTYRGQFDGITAPTLVLTGSDTPADIKAATAAATRAVGHARLHVLEGHGHLAHRSDPALVASAIRAFARS